MITEVTVGRDRVDSMKATDNHKVLAWRCPWKRDHLRRRISTEVWDKDNRFKPEWIRIGQLQEGDYLVVPTPGIKQRPQVTLDLAEVLSETPRFKYDESEVWNYYVKKRHASICGRYLTLTPQVAWVVGYYIAEGHLGKRNGYARYAEWTSNIKEDYLRATLCESLSLDFDVDFKCAERHRDSGSSASVRANGVVAEVFNYFAPGVHDTKQLNHGEQLITSQEHAEAFLAGLYAGDGSKEPAASTLSTTSKVLHEQVKELLVSCGVVPSVSSLDRPNRKKSYQVRFVRNCSAAERIHDQIVFFTMETHSVSIAKPKAFVKDGCMYSRISSVEKVRYKGPVYDMCIENVHAYRSPIGLYHNSDVDIRDIRVRYVNELGRDLHDYGLWENQLKSAMSQPYLEDSTNYLHNSGGIDRAGVSRALYKVGHSGSMGPDLFITSSWATSRVDVQYNDPRDNDMRRAMLEQIDGY